MKSFEAKAFWFCLLFLDLPNQLEPANDDGDADDDGGGEVSQTGSPSRAR